MPMQRRDFLVSTSAAGASGLLGSAGAWADPATRQASGLKVGEVGADSAILWMRLTQASGRRADGLVRKGRPRPYPANLPTRELQESCAGGLGRARVTLSRHEDMREPRSTDWADVTPATDFVHQFRLGDLAPDTLYHYRAETSDPSGKRHAPLAGHFRTAPRPQDHTPIGFAMTTCQKRTELDHPDGFHIYESMLRLAPHFYVSAGDLVYYDGDDPKATNVELGRFHWQRMFSFPRHVRMLLRVPGYFQKDDHDSWINDGWPTKAAPPGYRWTFADGARTFREQVPMGEQLYRTFRWGKTLQIWFTEGRDFRSANPEPDGPRKTMWGVAQREWLKKTLLASDADWKVLVSPTPLVGPDRGDKHDNQANDTFAHEGREFRLWAKKNLGEGFFVLNGDRHWQYHSVHPETGTKELSVGAASESHAKGASTSPGEDPSFHRFHRIGGGFLHAATSRSKGGDGHITFRLCDVFGKTVFETSASRKVG